MKSALLSIAVAVVSTMAAHATTDEQAAFAAGQVRSAYDRVRFICLANGFPMQTYEQLHPGEQKLHGQLKAKYPDFYAAGAAKGVRSANAIMSDADDRARWCAVYGR
ncbi:hypothetical protein [Bradyrhizobium sp. SZCCHNRI2010]|uniref:hypothetical protein n=1 Tax=Bradyrhizobium sp. SZCCHNRI2010 TaxID=3057283 RepID=UPI0028ED5A6F|nr:hypothetical protein [Bradyrhizobium sp. SZCCHNRI2010]